MARRSDHTRSELRALALQTAREIVAQEGQDALTTRRLAGAIGYTAGSLYLVFRNLDDLVLQLNGETLDQLHAVALATAGRHEDPREGLLALAREYIRFAFQNESLWSLVFTRTRPKDIPDWYEIKVSQSFDTVEALLRRLAPRRSNTEVRAAARAIWSGVHGTCVLGLADRLGTRRYTATDELATLLVTSFLDGFISPVAKPLEI